MSKTSVSTEIIDVNAATAMKWLQSNPKNRPISDVIVERYATLMRDDKWQFNGEAVIFSEDGILMDGQHRLSALLKTNKTIKMVVVKGVAHKTFSTLDIGKKRSGGDALAVFNKEYSAYRVALSAAVQTCLSFGRNGVWGVDTGVKRNRFTHDDIIEYMEKNKGLLRSVEFVQTLSGARKLAPMSGLVALHYLFQKKDLNLAEKFFQKLNTGENLFKHDPVLLLRSKLMQMKHSGGVFRTNEVVPVFCKAWELARDNRRIERLVIPHDYVPVIK